MVAGRVCCVFTGHQKTAKSCKLPSLFHWVVFVGTTPTAEKCRTCSTNMEKKNAEKDTTGDISRKGRIVLKST